jgi:hypothetical protein
VETAPNVKLASSEQVGRRGTSSGAIISFGLAAISLGLLLGIGPISVFPAALAVLGGAWSRYRLSASTQNQGGKRMATAAVLLGLAVGALSVIMMVGTHAT